MSDEGDGFYQERYLEVTVGELEALARGEVPPKVSARAATAVRDGVERAEVYGHIIFDPEAT